MAYNQSCTAYVCVDAHLHILLNGTGRRGVTLFPTRLVPTQVPLYFFRLYLHSRFRMQLMQKFIHSYKPKTFCCICGGGRGNGGTCPTKTLNYTRFCPPRHTPPSLRPGMPPWNNDGCKMNVASQTQEVNPLPSPGGKNAWHAPVKQVRGMGVVVWLGWFKPLGSDGRP